MAKEFITIDASSLKSFNYSEFLADYYSTTGTASGTGTWLGGDYLEDFAFASGSQYTVTYAEAGNDRQILVKGTDMQYDGIEELTGYSGTMNSIEFGYKYTQTGYDEVAGETRSELYNLGHGLVVSGINVSAEAGTGFGPDNEFYALMNNLRHTTSVTSTYIDALYELFGSKAQYFIGSRNADTYVGTEFGDKIDGGKGIDTLDGGDGKDRFLFSKGDSGKTYETADTILNFVLADDRINLHDIDAVAGKKGNQDFTWIGTKDFTGKAGQLHYERIEGETYASVDWNGDKKADFMIHLDGDFKLTADHFVL